MLRTRLLTAADLSTTAALVHFAACVVPDDVCSDSVVRVPGAVAARPTSPGSAPPAALSTTPTPPAAGATPAPSTGSVQRPAAPPPFLAVAFDRLCPRHCEKGMRQQ